MKKNKFFKNIVACFVLLSILVPFNFDSLIKNKKANAQSYSDYVTVIDNDEIWNGEVNLAKPVSIESGATLTIEKGTKIFFDAQHPMSPLDLVVNDGKIIAQGTMENPIIFDKKDADDKFSIIFASGSGNQSFLRYVRIENGGYDYDWAPPVIISQNKKSNYFNFANAQAVAQMPALRAYSGNIHIENSIFSASNYTSIYADYNGKVEIVNSNFKQESGMTVISNAGEDGYVFLKNNWYENFNPDNFSGRMTLDGERKNDLIADPAIVVPGIMGSEKSFSGLTLDPISRTYDDLVDSFETNGYEKDINLFTFPYNWRKSNIETAELLQEKIQSVSDDTKVSKTDIVAHSMGGLITREYIESNYYQNNIDQLITLGTPHRGAPKAYLKWEAGEGFFTILEKLGRHHLRDESQHAGYDSLFEYIQNEVPSVKELLPDYDYLFDVEKGEMRNYPDNYPRNEFLENINKAENIEKLQLVDFTNIVGKIGLDAGEEKNSTISRIDVVKSEKENLWEDGMPEDFYNEETDQGLEYGIGDETVPLFSAESIPFNTQIKIDASHGNLPIEAQCLVLEELAEIEREDCVYVDKFRVGNILLFNLFSPIDVQIVAPDGKRIGKNFETGEIFDEIEGAYYTGYDTENEMVAIPNPQDGKYKILTQGTGEGEYAIEVVKINQDEQGEVSEIVSRTQGTAQAEKEEEIQMQLEADEIIIENTDTTPPTIQISSPEKKEYLNNQIIPISYQIQDDKAQQENIEKAIFFGGKILNQEELDLSLLHLGKHTLKIIAKDEAQNESEKEIDFWTTTNLVALRDNINHYFDLNLIENRQEKDKLLRTIQLSENCQDLLEKISNQKNMPTNVKDRLTEQLQHRKREYVEAVSIYIRSRIQQKKIDLVAGELLIEGFRVVGK